MARIALLIPIIFSCGCFGLMQNPSYFPFYLPTGDIIRTHAKPPGAGYFKNFDPKACRIEINPPSAQHPCKAQVVLIATVFDKDNDARRKRRVEWTLEGPGSIVEVDESGYLAGRGYQVTEKYAVSYTDMLTHTITRGGEGKNEFCVEAGQTWCVVSSPVPGETIVTVHAPEIYDWEKRRAFCKLVWGDGGFVPMGGPVRAGRETDSTLYERLRKDGPTSQEASLMLDARLPKAVAVNRESTAVISLANMGRQESTAATIRTTLPDGVEFVRAEPAPTRRSGRELFWNVDRVAGASNKDINLILKPTKTGAIALTAAAETADGLKANTRAEAYADTSSLQVTVEPPAFAAVGETVDVRITVNNPSNVPIENAVAWVTPDAGVSAPGGTVPVEVKVGTIPAGASRTAVATLRAEKAGKAKVRVDVTADGGVSARGEGTIGSGKAELMVKIVGPETVPLGDAATYEVQVANAGDVQATDIQVRANLPRGLNSKGESGTGDGATWKLATLAPGEQRTFRMTASADRLSDLSSITATASGILANGGRLHTAKTSVPVAVRGQPVLTLEVSPSPGPVAIGGRVQYRVTVRNRGNAPARDVAITAEFSEQLRAVSNAGTRLGELGAGETKTVTFDAEAASAGDARATVTLQSRDLQTPLKEEQATRISKR